MASGNHYTDDDLKQWRQLESDRDQAKATLGEAQEGVEAREKELLEALDDIEQLCRRVIVIDEDTCAVDITRNLVAFTQYESCGKCFPCRLGMEQLLEVVERIADLQGRPEDVELLRSIGQTMEASSLCGHGQLGFGPIRSAIQHFEGDFLTHINEKRCPTGSCLTPMIAPKNTRPYAAAFVPPQPERAEA